jgi:hypothetical protein
MRGQIATFPIDHPTPRSSGGATALSNLALACPHCNGYKWAHTTATDPESAAVVPLFNPRVDTWDEHFQWSATDPALIEGKSACGRATLLLLRMNHPNMVDIRRLLTALHLFPG